LQTKIRSDITEGNLLHWWKLH